MAPKFITLHEVKLGTPLFINTTQIVAFYKLEKNSGTTIFVKGIDHGFSVKESTEKIAKLISGESDGEGEVSVL